MPATNSALNQGLHVLTRVALTLAPVCKAEGLSLSQYRHLFLIAEEPVRASALAEAFEVSRPRIAMSIAALADLGLVRRKVPPDDRRGVTISITPQGRRTLRRVETALLRHLGSLAGPDAVDRLLEDALAFREQLDDRLRVESAGRRIGPSSGEDE